MDFFPVPQPVATGRARGTWIPRATRALSTRVRTEDGGGEGTQPTKVLHAPIPGHSGSRQVSANRLQIKVLAVPGAVAEWLNAPVLKTGGPVRVS